MCRLFLLRLLLSTTFAFYGFSDAQYIAGEGAATFPSSNANFGTFYSTPDTIDNEVINAPAIRCTERGVEFSINTRNPFRGNLYVQGEFGMAECRREFYNNEAPAASIEVRLGDCGMIREKRPHGMSYSLVLITNFHPRFVTRVDRAYKIFCAYQQAERPVGVDLEVGSVPEESVSSDALMVPECEYTMRIGDLNGPLATGTVKVGDLIYHRWECQRSDGYGMLVKNCRVFDGGNDNVTLLDERGCPTHSGVVQSPPVYSDGLTMAFAPVFAFHFPDRTQMNFRCQIQTCNKLDNECQGLTPPNCQQSFSAADGLRGGDQLGYSVPPTGVGFNPSPPPISNIPTLASTVVEPYPQQQQMMMQQHPPFIGAGISPSSPPNALPLDRVLQGNPSQVLQGLQRPPWHRKSSSIKHRAEPRQGPAAAAAQAVTGRRGTTTIHAEGAEAGTERVNEQQRGREQMELEHRILMATQQLKHNEDGSWPPSLVIFGTGNKSAGGMESARRFFRPIPLEERELRQRQRRAEEHTQDVVATSTVVNDGLHSMEWSNENGSNSRVFRPRALAVPTNTKLSSSAFPPLPEAMQCLHRSTLIALFAALAMLSAVVTALIGHICWTTMALRCRRRWVGKSSLINWRSNGVSSVDGTFFGGRQKTSAFEVPSVFTHPSSITTTNSSSSSSSAISINTMPTNAMPQTADRSVQEEVEEFVVVDHSPQAMLAGILNSNLHTNANANASSSVGNGHRAQQHQQKSRRPVPPPKNAVVRR